MTLSTSTGPAPARAVPPDRQRTTRGKGRATPGWVRAHGSDLLARWRAGEPAPVLAELLGDLGFAVTSRDVFNWMQRLGAQEAPASNGSAGLRAAVMALAADGRWYTAGDFAQRLARAPDAPVSNRLRAALADLVKSCALVVEKHDVRIYRLAPQVQP